MSVEPPELLVDVDADVVLDGLLDCEPTFATPVELDGLDEPVLSIEPNAKALKPELPLLPANSALGGLGAVTNDILVLAFAEAKDASAELIRPAPEKS